MEENGVRRFRPAHLDGDATAGLRTQRQIEAVAQAQVACVDVERLEAISEANHPILSAAKFRPAGKGAWIQRVCGRAP